MARKPKANNNKQYKMTQISISLPSSLVKEIDKMAESDNRNRSNFIAHSLAQMAKEFRYMEEANS